MNELAERAALMSREEAESLLEVLLVEQIATGWTPYATALCVAIAALRDEQQPQEQPADGD